MGYSHNCTYTLGLGALGGSVVSCGGWGWLLGAQAHVFSRQQHERRLGPLGEEALTLNPSGDSLGLVWGPQEGYKLQKKVWESEMPRGW